MIKKVLAILLLLTMMTGCGENNQKPVEEQEKTNEKSTAVLSVDFSEITGSFRPLNGINNGPVSRHTEDDDGTVIWTRDMSDLYRDLQITYVRPHDMEYPFGSDRYVDIHCIFPDASRDVEDPDAYCFSYTDDYIKRIYDSGAQIFFRLGESIGSFEEESLIYVNPPEDIEKWAKVCANIIRHYNEGWNNGYEYGIEYWEIWNEPDNKKQWTGSYKEYCEFYKKVSRYLRTQFSDIKIGGGVLATVKEESIETFLDIISDDGEDTPLDFFSWHTYSNHPAAFYNHAETVRSILDKYGYTDTESILDEWNYLLGWETEQVLETWEKLKTFEVLPFYMASLITMQYSSIDKAMYYSGSEQEGIALWCGLYETDGETVPGYEAFSVFADLFSMKNTADITFNPQDTGIFSMAGVSEEGTAGIVLVNYNSVETPIQVLSDGKNNGAILTSYTSEHPMGQEQELDVLPSEADYVMQPGEVLYCKVSLM